MAPVQSSSLGLNGLPVETLRQIMGLLTRKELKALRLMSQQLCSIASERMFESITLSTTDASFIQLFNIASHDRWSDQVRRVDWILLNAYGTNPGTSQTIVLKDKRSWGPSLLNVWPSRLPSGEDVSYIGLDLQCQAMKCLNPQTVQFRCGLKCHREGREPWQDHAVRSEQVESSQFADAPFGWGTISTNVRRGPVTVSADDVFSVLRQACLGPTVLKTPTITMHLEYSDVAEIEHVSLFSIKDDPARRPFLVGGTEEAEEEYKEWLAEMRFFRPTMNGFHSLARNKNFSLKTLKLSGTPIHVTDLDKLLGSNRGLRELQLSDLELSSHDPDMETIPAILDQLRQLWRKRLNRNLRVELQDLTMDRFRGTFSATEQEVGAWTENDRDDLLDALGAALTRTGEPGTGGGDDDEGEVELGARFRYEADFADEDKYACDTEVETIDMICRQAVQEYSDEMNAGPYGP